MGAHRIRGEEMCQITQGPATKPRRSTANPSVHRQTQDLQEKLVHRFLHFTLESLCSTTERLNRKSKVLNLVPDLVAK